MKNKGLTITLIVLLSLVVVGLITLLVVILSGYTIFSWGDIEISSKKLVEQEYIVSDIREVQMNLRNTDIDIKSSSDDKVKIVYYGKEKYKDKVSISLDDNTLLVSETDPIICFGICFNYSKVVLYVPETFSGDFTLKTVSGDVRFFANYKDVLLDVKTTSGDIITNDLKQIQAKTTSGQVTTSNVLLDSKIVTTSGDIKVGSVNGLTIQTTSGDIEASSINDYLSMSSVSGDIDIDSISISKNSNIKTVSGDVKIDKANSIYVETNTVSGDVSIDKNDRKSDIVLKVKTTSGDIEVN